jgi:hypothetical protein
MEPHEPTLVFRSAIGPLLRLSTGMGLWGSIALVLAAAVSQYRADRFPSYFDLLLSAVIPWAIAAILGFLFWGAARLFPVKLTAVAIRCYDTAGLYQTVRWADVQNVEPISPYGLRYLQVSAKHLRRPVTVPLWLEDMLGFSQAVERYAGKDHPLTRALKSAA